MVRELLTLLTNLRSDLMKVRSELAYKSFFKSEQQRREIDEAVAGHLPRTNLESLSNNADPS